MTDHTNATDPADSQADQLQDMVNAARDVLSDERFDEFIKVLDDATDPVDDTQHRRNAPPVESYDQAQTIKLEKALIYMAYRGGRWLGDRFVTPRQADERIHEDMLKTLPELAALIQSEASRIANDKINNLPHGIYNVNNAGWMKLSNEDLDPKAEARRIAETVIGDDEDVNKRQGGTYWVQYSARNLLRREQRTKLKALTAPEGDTK